MPEQQNFVSYVLLQQQTPKAYYCKETKKKFWRRGGCHVCHLASARLAKKSRRKFHCFAPPPLLFLPLGDRKTKSFCTSQEKKELEFRLLLPRYITA